MATPKRTLTPQALNWIGASVFAVLALAHFLVIVRNAVDLPYLDEWRYFEPGGLSQELNWGWIFQQQNEHRVILTHLMVWILYRVDRLDMVANVAVNFPIYLIIPLLYLWISRLQLGVQAWIIWPFLWLLLTPLDWENHSWGFQNQWHFHLITMTLGVILLFHPRPTTLKTALGTGSLILDVASFAGGVVPPVTIALAFAIYRTWQMSRGGFERRDVMQTLAVLLVVSSVAAWWYAEFEKPPHNPPLVWPTDREFWAHYLNGLSLAFGNGSHPIRGRASLGLLGIFYGFVWIVPLIWQTFRRESGARDATLVIRVVLVGATLVGFAIVSMGRGFWGVGLPSRYYEMVLPLVPVTALSWAAIPRRRMRNLVLVGLWVLILCIDGPNWNDTMYEAHRNDLREAEACIRAYYARREQDLQAAMGRSDAHRAVWGRAKCLTTDPNDIGRSLDRARELGVMFTRTMHGP